MKKTLLALALAALGLTTTHAALIITEVDPTGSSTSTYAADWFELTNTGASSIDLTGWKMDDSHNSFSHAVAISGITSISAGQSVVFIEDSSASSDSALASSFESAWFGSNVPSGFTIGFYGGSGVGLSSSSDAVNIFNASGVLQAGVQFGASTSNVTFDNWVAQITNSGSTDGAISTLSAVGVNGAFKDANNEIGSPGAVPEPGTYGIVLFGGAILMLRRRHQLA